MDNDKAAEQQHELVGVIEKTGENEFVRNSHPEAQWFETAGLGLFIHWGISSVHGGVDISWGMIKNTAWDAIFNGENKVTPNEYFNLAKNFNPVKYDPYKWLKAAADAGFKYAVLTTRHHDGFALWPSEYGEFSTKNYIGGRDLVSEYVDACRKVGLKVGLYYSPPDWYYNRSRMSFGYATDGTPDNPHLGLNHEQIELKKYEGYNENDKGLGGTKEEKLEFISYIRNQIEELLTNYGKIDLIWFDGGPEAISIERIREFQPGILVNPRMHGYGDFKTPECSMPKEPLDGWWEFCDIWMNGIGWGYCTNEEYKSAEWAMSRYKQVASMGGNYLINVGPRPNGEMPDIYYERLIELKLLLKIKELI